MENNLEGVIVIERDGQVVAFIRKDPVTGAPVSYDAKLMTFSGMEKLFAEDNTKK